MAQHSKKKKKDDQTTLCGTVAFNPITDCPVCKAQSPIWQGCPAAVPHRSHHPLCNKNSKSKGQGVMSQQQLNIAAEATRLKNLFSAPLKPHEKGSREHTTKESIAMFFKPKQTTTTKLKDPPTILASEATRRSVTAKVLCDAVATLTSDAAFCNKHKAKGAPIAMMALARVVTKTFDRKDFENYFEGTTMTVPPCYDNNNPYCHSIVGQKLLCIDWKKTHGVDAPCPDKCCHGHLDNDRTNFSKNQTLFPMFSLEGAPSWAIVQSMISTKCKRRFDANVAEVLVTPPDYVALSYPVEAKHALSNKASHLSRSATEAFESIILTCGNGELCSKLLHNAIQLTGTTLRGLNHIVPTSTPAKRRQQTCNPPKTTSKRTGCTQSSTLHWVAQSVTCATKLPLQIAILGA